MSIVRARECIDVRLARSRQTRGRGPSMRCRLPSKRFVDATIIHGRGFDVRKGFRKRCKGDSCGPAAAARVAPEQGHVLAFPACAFASKKNVLGQVPSRVLFLSGKRGGRTPRRRRRSQRRQAKQQACSRAVSMASPQCARDGVMPEEQQHCNQCPVQYSTVHIPAFQLGRRVAQRKRVRCGAAAPPHHTGAS